MWWHAFQHWLGVDDVSGRAYAFWSGFGSDLSEISLAGGLAAVYRKHVCHTRWCWRIGHHDFTDTATGLSYRLCRRCTPEHPGRKPPTRGHIARIHEQNQRGGGDVAQEG